MVFGFSCFFADDGGVTYFWQQKKDACRLAPTSVSRIIPIITVTKKYHKKVELSMKGADEMSKLFGKMAKDKVTGFQGVVTGKLKWMYGCTQYCLTPKVDKDGKLVSGEWFDEGRLEILKDSIRPEEVVAEKNGCDLRNMPAAR